VPRPDGEMHRTPAAPQVLRAMTLPSQTPDLRRGRARGFSEFLVAGALAIESSRGTACPLCRGHNMVSEQSPPVAGW
jgi:hypothetical protein